MPSSSRTPLTAFDGSLPLERARTIPSDWYFRDEVFALEKERVFTTSWQVVGRIDQVAQPGRFLTTEIAGEPVLVIRDRQQQLRGFYNVCRHRAAPLLTQPYGEVSKLRCRYHGWTYDIDGRLLGTPEFDGVQDFCKEANGLVPVQVQTWGPWVWVYLGDAGPSLEDFIAPLPAWSMGRGIETLEFFGRKEYELNCNWKVYVDNYLDGGYHVNTVHPGLAGVLDYAEYRTTVHGNTSVQTSPIKPANNADPAAVKTREGSEAAYWWVFPNFMLNLYQGVMDTNLVLPLGTNRCRVIFDFYFANASNPSRKPYMEQSIQVAHQIQEEDMQICEEVQKGLNSRSYVTGRFSVKREIAGYYFHQLLGSRLQGAGN